MSIELMPQEWKSYLAETPNIRVARLVRFELPYTDEFDDPIYDYMTDWGTNITWGSNEYQAGKLLKVGDIKRTIKFTSHKLSLDVAGEFQEELDRALAVSPDSEEASYLNKEIKVWLALMTEENEFAEYNSTELEPVPIFLGTITQISIKESQTSSTVVWTCADKLANFEKVVGRLTSDEAHRGLDSFGVPTGSAKRPEYETDLGFSYAGEAINVLAKYRTTETKIKTKKNWIGMVTGTYEVKYQVTRDLDISINLDIVRLPVVYGVRKVGAVPIFVDAYAPDPRYIYAVYAVCEGEIEGFLDINLNKDPVICYGKEDSDQKVCIGSRRDGDTLAIGESGVSPGSPEAKEGTTHGQEYNYSYGSTEYTFWTYHGLPNQSASSVLVDIAAAGNFAIQQDQGIGPEYWDSNFKLLDTAYVVVRFKIDDASAQVPDISCCVEGRKVKVFSDANNYVDTNTSLNLAWQIYDYATSYIFGAEIDESELDIDSFLDVAATCDREDTSWSDKNASVVPFWRYLGWKTDNVQDNAYLIQTNPILDTSETVYSNLSTLVTQHNLMFTLVGEQYRLAIEDTESSSDAVAQYEYIGNIAVKDLSERNKWNSIKATIEAPSYDFEKRNINFYNSGYKEADGGVERMGNYSYTLITNFYTARAMAERQLRNSRYTRNVTAKLHHKFIHLAPMSVVDITHERFGWDEKPFRISETTLHGGKDLAITLQLTEYKDVYAYSDQGDDNESEIDPPRNTVGPARGITWEDHTANDAYPFGANGSLKWQASVTKDVTLYKIAWTGLAGFKTVQPNIVYDPADTYEYIVYDLPAGTYDFTIVAVRGTGEKSPDAGINTAILDPKGVDSSLTGPQTVVDFEVTNKDFSQANAWYGPDVDLSWAPNSETNIVEYRIEVLSSVHPSEDILLTIDTANTTYTFDYATNKSTYPGTGVYRDLYFRIKALDDDGYYSDQWVYAT